jgi:hypothetical protein
MAKHDEVTKTTTAPTNGATPAPAATPEVAAAPDERYRKLPLDDAGSTFAYGDTSKSGQTVNRIDFIRSSWQVGKQPRGAIAKEASRLGGKKITYQIVFSATKGLPGGPAPAPAAPAAGTTA